MSIGGLRSERVGGLVGIAAVIASFSCPLAWGDFRLGGGAAVADAKGIVAGFHDVVVMGQPVEQGGVSSVVSLASPKTVAHSANVRWVVMMTLVSS
jgi:hypothetical protein